MNSPPPLEPANGVEAETPEDAKHPLRGEIALCLSGGGYRAAAFHLGSMTLLEELGLRDRIKVISALSGGAIFSACYSIAQKQGQDFPTFAAEFRQKLANKNPMAEAFEMLPSSGGKIRPPSLIRSMAKAYAASDFIGPTRFGELMRSDRVADDLIFGSTEFRSALSFRFQQSSRTSPNIGNRPPLDIPPNVAADMRVADMVAASSCFPAAFEPMIFPDDFVWTQPLQDVRNELTEALGSGVPLMDGGIYDNQGVDGALAVYRRRGMQAGLLLVCDTSAREDDIYSPPTHQPRGGFRLRTLRRFGKAFFAGSLISAVALVYKAFSEVQENHFSWLDTVLFGLPVLVCLLLAVVLRRVDRRISIEQQRVYEHTSVAIWPNVSQLRLLDFIDLVNARLLSLVSLTNDIFMKRVRGLIQSSLRIGERYRNRVISNQIYDLDIERKSLFEQNPWMRPNADLVAMARKAEAMPSTIWFNDEKQLDNLVRCGHATTCFSLLHFLLRQEKEALTDPSTPESELFERAKAIWMRLNS